MRGLRSAVWAAVALGLALVAGCDGSADDGPSYLDANSTCEERYEAAINSPSSKTYGTEGILPKGEWIANCEAG